MYKSYGSSYGESSGYISHSTHKYKFSEFVLGKKKKKLTKEHPAKAVFMKIREKHIDKIRNVLPKKMMLKAIHTVLMERVATKETPLYFFEFIYDSFIHKYGLKHVAEKKYI